MMEQKLILNDDSEILDSYAVQANGKLWVYVYADISFACLFSMLSDPEKTSRIVCEQFGVRNTYDGFTDLFCIRKEDGGWISAGLRYPDV